MSTIPPEQSIHGPTDEATSATSATSTPEPAAPPNPGQALETVAHLLVRTEAMVWATGQALGLSYTEQDRARSEGRLHALVGITGEIAEEALDETEDILDRVFGYTRSLDPGR